MPLSCATLSSAAYTPGHAQAWPPALPNAEQRPAHFSLNLTLVKTVVIVVNLAFKTPCAFNYSYSRTWSVSLLD